ncbi:MAG: hypothetical protein PHN39_00160 [Candidatus Pacebacteria bacterium]|nr:hypothetical protein [Candidatus Paceibacterota bacterium]
MKKILLILSTLIAALFYYQTFAQSEPALDNFQYPIKELGNCPDKEACKAYCDKEENRKVCLSFAENHNLMPKEEIAQAKKMLEAGEESGPGGCLGQKQCEQYCDDIKHIEECLSFAEKYQLLSQLELQEMKQVASALRQGVSPPPCKNKKECDEVCQQPENMEVCLSFAEAAGLMSASEMKEAKQVLEAVKKGAKMPPCRGKQECDQYCQEENHFEECLNFAQAAGFMTAQEAAMAKRTGGKGPGGCKNKEECDAYCNDESHIEECIDFGVKNGMMTAEEAEQAKKMVKMGLQGGPGGCKGKEECEKYCNDVKNLAECADFAEKAGFMKPEDANRARKMAELGAQGGPGGCKGGQECQSYCDNPTNRQECLDFAVKMGEVTPEQASQMQQMMNQAPQGQPGSPMPAAGPGGCKTPEECQSFCQNPDNQQECMRFGPAAGGNIPAGDNFMGPQGGGTGGQAPDQQQIQEMIQQNMPQGVQVPENMAPPPGGMPAPGGMTAPPTGEEIQQIQQQIIQQMMNQAPQMTAPPPGDGSQGLSDQPGAEPPPSDYSPGTAPSTEPPPQSFWQKTLRTMGQIIVFWFE